MKLRLRLRTACIKLTQWEYWPAKAFYYPVAPYLLWLMLKSRHLCFWSAANPGIYTGGMGLESKFDTIKITPAKYRPAATLVLAGTPLPRIRQQMQEAGLSFPLIAKPDLGFRGLLVRKVQDEASLTAYFQQYPIDVILQEYVNLPEEVGLLYYRFPGKAKGHISSLTTKSFLHVTGNGRDTVRALAERSPRALLQLPRLEEQAAEVLDSIPAAGEKIPLSIVGNHNKGTQFFNGNALVNERMQQCFDQITQQIDGFFYGRFDLKCQNLEALESGEGLRIIEINGVCSEPTHIYDPQRGSYWSALRAIGKHWLIIFRIALANHDRGTSYLSHRITARAFLRLFAYQRQLKKWAQQSAFKH